MPPIPFNLHFVHTLFNLPIFNIISGEGVGGDEKDLLKDNLMRDIQDGFRQRRLPDGGFKVSGGRQIDIINMEIGFSVA